MRGTYIGLGVILITCSTVWAQPEPTAAPPPQKRCKDGSARLEQRLRELEAKPDPDADEIRIQRGIVDLARKDYAACVERERLARAADEAREREKAEKQQREEARREAVLSDPKAMTVVYSAEICWYQTSRRESMAAIAKEMKYARVTGGGMVDRKAIYDWQQDVRKADDSIPPIQKQLKALKAKALPCSDKTVSALVECLNGPLGSVLEQAPEHCDSPPYSEYVNVIE